MDPSTDSGTLPTHTAVGGPVLEQELSLFNCCGQTESGGKILLQLLEFKTHLLEAVEELHIRRGGEVKKQEDVMMVPDIPEQDAETRFEDQISKLVLEKQELEWEKESLQHQIETAANQHTDSLVNVKKQFQAKIRNIEEEKGKYQVSAELKDKEINSLKEELKSLQLRKYNLEKKSTELEQKLSLQSRSKDSHLNQMGEVEKRFSALSRQCAMVKQAHEKLEQNVDEAMKIKKKLTAENEKQEATIVSLKKELEEVSNKLIKYKMSPVTQDKAQSPTSREQHCQQLHQILNMETKMNKNLREENGAVRAEKQEVMRSLQHTQQLLLSQTQTVSRVELELQTQREQYQALKQEHGVMREERKAMEDKVAQLMESCAASKNSWDKEKARLLDCIKSEQRALEAVKEAYDRLHQEHTELSSQMRDSSQSLWVSAKVFPTLVGDIRGEETLNEPISGSELPSSGSLQHLASTQAKIPDSLKDTGAVTKLVTMGTTGVSAVSITDRRSNNGSVDFISNEKSNEGNGGMSEKEQGYKDDVKQTKQKNHREEGERKMEQHWNREDFQGEDVKEGGSTGETRGTLIAQTTDRQQDSQGSTEDTEDPEQTETETKDRAEGRGPHGTEERGKIGVHTAEAQIPAQTTTDTTTERIDAQQVIDSSMDSESPPAACEPPDCLQRLSQKISEKDSSHETKSYELQREVLPFCSDEYQSGQEVQAFANTAPLAAQADGIASIRELETITTQLGNTSDITSDRKHTDEMCDIDMSEECVLARTTFKQQAILCLGVSEQRGQLKITDDNDGDSSAFKNRDSLSNIETSVNHVCETAQQPMIKSKDACTDITMVTADLECRVEMGSSQDIMKNDKVEDAGDARMIKSETDLKQSVNPSQESNASPETQKEHQSTESCEKSPAKETMLDESHESSLLSYKKHISSYDWSDAQRTSSRCKTDVSILHTLVQGSPKFEQNASRFAGLVRHPPGTLPVFLNKVPLVITRASDLLNTSSASETAASTRRHQQGEWTGPGEAYMETGAADKDSRASFPVSTSITVSRPSWQTTPGCSRAPTSAGSRTEQPSCSQEREDQLSSFRAQMCKIEQFLNAERLGLSKR